MRSPPAPRPLRRTSRGLLRRCCGCKSGALASVAASIAHDPTFALGHAALALLGHELCAEVDIQRPAARRLAARRARAPSASAATCTPWSRHVRGDSRPLVAHLAAYPRDALLLSTAVPTIAFAGVTEVPEEAWAIVERAIPAYGDDWWFTGLLAFVRQEQGRFDEAMELSCRSLAEEPGAGHSAHARAHAHYETGDHEAGLAWMDALGHRRRRLDRQPQPLLLARGAARAVPGRPRRRPPPVRRPAAARARARLPGARGHRLAAVPLGAHARTPTDVPGLEQVAALAGRDVLERPATPFLAMHAAVTLLALDDGPGLRAAGGLGRARTPTRPSARWSPRWPGALGRWPPGSCSAAADAARRARRPQSAGSAAPTPSARSSRRPGSPRCCAPTGCDEARALLDARLDRRHSPRDDAGAPCRAEAHGRG